MRIHQLQKLPGGIDNSFGAAWTHFSIRFFGCLVRSHHQAQVLCGFTWLSLGSCISRWFIIQMESTSHPVLQHVLFRKLFSNFAWTHVMISIKSRWQDSLFRHFYRLTLKSRTCQFVFWSIKHRNIVTPLIENVGMVVLRSGQSYSLYMNENVCCLLILNYH